VYTVFAQPVFIALLAGVVLAFCTMAVNLPKYDFKNEAVNMLGRITGTLNGGAANYPNALLSVATPNALASVITATATFGAIVGMMAGLQIHPILLTIIIVCVVVAITSAPPAALFVCMGIIIPITMGGAIAAAAGNAAAAALPVSAHAIFRVAALAASTFETLPVNGLIILGIFLAKTSHKESYLPMFLMTVIYTLIGTIVAALLCLVPGLA
jgi:H+/gluconate symporter-like permease